MMDALEFIKAIKQMLSTGANNSTVQKYISAQKKNDYEGMVEAAEQWAAEHPAKTRQSEFLKLFPGADVGETDGCLTLNPCNVYEKMRKECGRLKCSECRKAFWSAEVEE
mgnify:CR=1 FL=1